MVKQTQAGIYYTVIITNLIFLVGGHPVGGSSSGLAAWVAVGGGWATLRGKLSRGWSLNGRPKNRRPKQLGVRHFSRFSRSGLPSSRHRLDFALRVRRSDLHPKHIPLVHSHWPGLAQEVVCHYAGGEAGQVEIESQWTARKREQSGIFLTVRKHPAP